MMNVISGLVANEDDNNSRTVQDYAGRIKTYRLRNGQLKRVIEQYGTSSDYDELD